MKYLVPLIILLSPFCSVYAQQDTGSGLDFLNIAPSSVQLSMSEASSSALTGSSAIYSNPALLVMEPSSSLDLNYTLWVGDVNNQSATVNLLQDNYAVGFGVYNSKSNEFEARSQPGSSEGSFSISYLAVSSSAAYQIGSFSAGITGHYLREEIFQYRANGLALNAGLAAEFMDRRIRVGTAVQNIGEMEELDQTSTPLPSIFRAGITTDLIEFTTPGLNDLPVLLSVHGEWIHPLEELSRSDFVDQDADNDFFSLALSADVAELIYLRGGYKFGPTVRPYSLGLGMNIDPVIFNYSLIPFTTGLGIAHSLGVQFYF